MKQMITLLILLPLFSRAQNSYTVSNIPGVNANFSTLQGAIDSVPAGSTLYLFPSSIDYGNVDIDKKISIIGTGYMLDLNAAPYNSPNPTDSGVNLSSVWFKPGSDDSYIQGVRLRGQTPGGRFYRFFLDNVNNVTINRCMLEIWAAYPGGNIEIETKNTSNCTFSQCYITGLYTGSINHSGGEQYIELGNGSQNLRFTNNLFDNQGIDAPMTFNHNINPVNYGNIIFTNNTFHIDCNNTSFCHYTYINNFFISPNPVKAVAGTVYLDGPGGYNITNVPNLFPANSNNYQGANADSIFRYASFGYHSFDQGLQIVDTSFAQHFASDGGQVGAFGGYNPYVLSGIPPLPWIYNITTTPDPKKRGNVLVHIKAKASN